MLSSNLAACAALEAGKRVLLIDLDFQGTLSESCIDPSALTPAILNKKTVAQFYRDGFGASDIQNLCIQMNQVSLARSGARSFAFLDFPTPGKPDKPMIRGFKDVMGRT